MGRRTRGARPAYPSDAYEARRDADRPPVTLTLGRDTIERIKRLAKKLEVSRGHIVDAAVEAYAKRHGEE